MKTCLSIILCLNSFVLFAQSSLDDIEALLKKDSTLVLYYPYRPFMLLGELKARTSVSRVDYFGGYTIDSMQEKNRKIKDYQGKEILIRSYPNRKECLLFGFNKREGHLELGHLNYIEWNGRTGISRRPGKLFLVTPVAGLAIKDRISGYTSFIRVSKNGAPFPVHIVSDTRDSFYTHPVLDVHSLFNNDIEAVYLFDNFWALKAIYKFSTTNELAITSFDKKAKKLTIKFDQESFHQITHTTLIHLYESCNRTGIVLKKFELKEKWLLETLEE